MTQAYWTQMQSDFDDLPMDRQESYQAQAQSDGLVARVAKVELKSLEARAHLADSTSHALAGSPAAPELPRMPALPCANVSDNALVALNILQPDKLPQSSGALAMTTDNAALCLRAISEAHGGHDVAAKLYRSRDEDAIVRSLVSIDELQKFLAKQPAKQAARRFQENTRRVGRPRGEVFPDKVVYPTCCTPVCAENKASYITSVHVLGMLADAAKRCSSPSKVAAADMLLSLEVSTTTPREQADYSFWWMIGASFQSGNHPATQTFWRCVPTEPIGGGTLVGLRLCIEKASIVEMLARSQSPFHKQSAAPQFFDEGDVARHALGASSGRPIGDITIRKLQFEEHLDSSLIILGEDTAFSLLTLAGRLAKLDQKEKDKAAAKAKAKGGAKAKADGDAKAIVGSSWLDFLTQEEGPAAMGNMGHAHAIHTKANADVARGGASAASDETPPPGPTHHDEAIRQLANSLGLADVALRELGVLDDKALGGLVEEIGEADLDALSDMLQELEERDEDEADRRETHGHATGDTTEGYGQGGDDILEDGADVATSPLITVPVTADNFFDVARMECINGMEAEFTGFASGALMNLRPNESCTSRLAGWWRVKGIAALHRINDKTLKMTCKAHPRCTCWVTVRTRGKSLSWRTS